MQLKRKSLSPYQLNVLKCLPAHILVWTSNSINQSKAQILPIQFKVASSKTIAVHGQCKVRRGHRSWFRIDSNQHKKPHHFHSVSLRSSLGSADAVCIDSGLAAICKKHFLVLEKKRYRKDGLRTSLACTLVLNSPSTELSRTMNLWDTSFDSTCMCATAILHPSDWAKTYRKKRMFMHCDFSLCWRVKTR